MQREWATEGGVDSLFANGNKTRWGLGYHLYPFSSDGGDTPRPSDNTSKTSADSQAVVVGSDGCADGDTDADIDDKATGTDTGVPKEGTGAFGHSGIGGSVAFCDSKRGLAVAVTTNHLLSNRVVAKRVIRCITKVLNFGGSYDDFS